MPALSATTATPDSYARHAAPAGAYAGAGWLLAAPATGQYELEGDPVVAEARRRRRRRAVLWALALVIVVGVVVAALVLTRSEETVGVPQVTGQTEQAAGATLRAAGLDPLPSLRSSVSVPSGLVISQSPAAGSEAKKGSHVNIVVSAGPASSSLTNVAGLTVAKAESKLHKAGLKTTRRSEPSKTVEAGRVIGTEPPAETEVQEGHLVTLLVSSGPAPVRVPDVVGQTLEAAEATLTNAELALGTVSRRVSSTQAPGTVVAQSPAVGATAHTGDTVDLTVAQAPKEVAVPSVEGAAQAAAAAALRHAGFKVKTQPHPTAEQSQVGVVLEQSPAGGARARKGSTVTIAVGTLAPQTTTTTTTSTPPSTTTTTTTPPAPATPTPE